ncbi:hypothetical protein H0H87_004249 [Tephrocybe sp. NHM501043]|nr:hypothetical protein H0H87_004249 [Tephrocybe sp. NHM501043]
MRTTNINDTDGVKALLNQLGGSEAWKNAVAAQENRSSSSAAPEQHSAPVAVSENVPANSASVAALLSQLQSSSWPHSKSTENGTITGHLTQPQPAVPSLPSAPSVTAPLDPKTLTFQQALPLIAQLADNPKIVETIRQVSSDHRLTVHPSCLSSLQLKKEQEDLERRLWEERRNIFRKFEEKVKVATTKYVFAPQFKGTVRNNSA